MIKISALWTSAAQLSLQTCSNINLVTDRRTCPSDSLQHSANNTAVRGESDPAPAQIKIPRHPVLEVSMHPRRPFITAPSISPHARHLHSGQAAWRTEKELQPANKAEASTASAELSGQGTQTHLEAHACARPSCSCGAFNLKRKVPLGMLLLFATMCLDFLRFPAKRAQRNCAVRHRFDGSLSTCSDGARPLRRC